MARSGPIIFVEDDIDDQDFLREIIESLDLPNRLIFFSNANEALTFLKEGEDQPFIIISDINLPGMNGLEFKRKIDYDPELRFKSIPFIFLSTSVNKNAVNEAYRYLNVQGFFEKPHDLVELQNLLIYIIQYWQWCKHPNS